MVKGVLRSAYNGSGRSLGAKDTKGVIKERTCAPVFVSGEELPEDDALMSRLVIIHLKLQNRKDEHYANVFDLSQQAAAHIYRLIMHKNRKTTQKLFAQINDMRNLIGKANPTVNPRVVLNYAITLGCYLELVNPDNDILFDYTVSGGSLSQRRDFIEADEVSGSSDSIMLSDFIDRVNIIVNHPDMKHLGWFKINDQEKTVSVWMTPIYDLWAKNFRQITGRTAPTCRTLIDYFKECSYFLKNRVSVRISNPDSIDTKTRSCIVFDIRKIPQNLRTWFVHDEDNLEMEV
jgi:hypothetical protein